MFTEGKAHRLLQSEERSTGMGATRCTAVLGDGVWIRVSELAEARNHGRYDGVQKYSVFVDVTTVSAGFYRSNSGKESVTIHDFSSDPDNPVDVVLASFDDADRWAWDRREHVPADPADLTDPRD